LKAHGRNLFARLALGSVARREATPGSDVESAIVLQGDAPGDALIEHALVISRRVEAGLLACGLRPDERGTTATNPLLVRSLASWQRAARSWLEDPTLEQALILVSVVVDSRTVWGLRTGMSVAEAFRSARGHPALLRQLARFSLSYRPPTGFLRGLVVEHSGEHRGRLDLKLGGLVPIVDLARWAGMAAGVTSVGEEGVPLGPRSELLYPAIAYPTYVNYITKTRRAAATACLSEYANYMERFYTTNLRYDQDTSGTSNDVTKVILDCAAQSQTGQYYSYASAAAPPLSQTAYKIIATPKDIQLARDTTCGILGIDQSGQRFYKGTSKDAAGLAVCWQH